MQLPPGEHSFKLVITRADGSVHWEEGGDRRLCVPELAAGAAARPLLHATCWRFGDTGATGVEVDRQQLQVGAERGGGVWGASERMQGGPGVRAGSCTPQSPPSQLPRHYCAGGGGRRGCPRGRPDQAQG